MIAGWLTIASVVEFFTAFGLIRPRNEVIVALQSHGNIE